MFRVLMIGVVLSFLTAHAFADDAEQGQALAEEKGCITCHGTNGVGTAPIYPNLNGQWERYLRLQLLAYRSGKRVNSIMNGFAQTLSDQEIRALAEFYGDQ